MKLKLTIVLFALLTAFGVFAETTKATGNITTIRHYGTGMILVYGPVFDSQPDRSHCAGAPTGILIAHDYSRLEQLLSLLMMAKATGKPVTVYNLEVASDCWAPTFTNSSYVDFH